MKPHAVCDGRGRPLVMLLSEGQMSDYKGAALMIDALRKIEGNLRVADGLDLHGMVTGTVSVAPGGRRELRGTVCRDLVLEEGSSVHLYGTLSGDVYNRGGELLIYGSFGGTLHREGGTTVIDPDAAIAGPILKDGASGVDRRRPFPTGPSYNQPAC